jgi:hypothetical protein
MEREEYEGMDWLVFSLIIDYKWNERLICFWITVKSHSKKKHKSHKTLGVSVLSIKIFRLKSIIF